MFCLFLCFLHVTDLLDNFYSEVFNVSVGLFRLCKVYTTFQGPDLIFHLFSKKWHMELISKDLHRYKRLFQMWYDPGPQKQS